MSLRIEDFSKICRMCLLLKNEMLPLHVPEVIKMIQFCVDVEVRVNDGFPQKICTECLSQINNYSAFRLLCKNSDEILHKIINDLNISVVADNLDEQLSTSNNPKVDFVPNQQSINVLNIPNSGNTVSSSISECDLLIKENFGNVSDDTELFQEQHQENDSLITEDFRDVSDDAEQYQGDNKRELCVKDGANEKETENYISDTKNGEEPECVYCTICSKHVIVKSFSNHLYRHNLENKYKCDECSVSFKTHYDLTRHIKAKHKRVKPLECEHCNKTFCTKYQLSSHVKLHDESETAHACDICGREFAIKKRLIRHKKFVHGEKGYFLCVICQKSFPYEKYLQIHVTRCHDLEWRAYRKKTCPICGKESMKLRVHMQSVHSMDKRYKCDQCTKEFALNSMLSKHIRDKHSGVKKEPEALCPICGKVCTTRGELKKHLVHHDENRKFNCHLCDKTYKTKSGLQYHLRVHKNIRPFSCTICSKKFLQKSKLERHQVVHTDERPFACHICGRRFNQTGARKTHMKVHGFS